jgi:tetratricopeptide (TPR) repeat protein
MNECLLCRFAHIQTELSCAVCGCEQQFMTKPEMEIAEDLTRRLAAAGRFGEAYASLEDLVARGEESADACLRLAWLGFAVGDLRALETWCHEAERLAPDWAEPHLALGWAFEQAGRLPEAIEEYDAGLRRGVAPEERAAWVRARRDAVQGRLPLW